MYDTLKKWWKRYKEGGLEGLLEWKVKGYQGKIKEEQLKGFEKELNLTRKDLAPKKR